MTDLIQKQECSWCIKSFLGLPTFLFHFCVFYGCQGFACTTFYDFCPFLGPDLDPVLIHSVLGSGGLGYNTSLYIYILKHELKLASGATLSHTAPVVSQR